jgi:hypothetical protein
MKDLLFTNPTFRKGLNLTVRNGDKWFKAVQPGDVVRLVDTDEPHKVIMGADILFTAYWPLREIPTLWLKYEHDPNCRTHANLEAGLVEAYGEEPITSNVTVIAFLTTTAHAATPPAEPAPVPQDEEVDEPNSDDTLESDE